MQKKRNRTKYSEQDFADNFYEVTKENSLTLTNKGFNEVSKISYQGYRNRYKIPWVDILEKFGKKQLFIDFIKEEYLKLYPNKNVSISTFYSNHAYFTFDVIDSIGSQYLCEYIGLKIRNYKLTHEDYKRNFINIQEKLSRIPLYNEFEELSAISMVSYSTFYKLDKGKIYQEIVKLFSSEQDISEYENNRMIRKVEVGLLGKDKQENKYSEDDLKKNLIDIFEEYYLKYNDYPSRRIFDGLSDIKNDVYRGRLNLSWLEICSSYGYKIDRRHKTEKQVLFAIENILNSKNTPQKTWDWLIGVGGKNMYCDGYFEEYNLVIEYDGEQHRHPIAKYGGEDAFIRRVANDHLKDKLLAEHNINLIRIDSRDKWYKEGYLEDRLKDYLSQSATLTA